LRWKQGTQARGPCWVVPKVFHRGQVDTEEMITSQSGEQVNSPEMVVTDEQRAACWPATVTYR
jgi:hypothetical protein